MTFIPPEILVRIFQLAAQSSKSSCSALSLVSSWARDIALPYHFSVVVLRNRRDVLRLRYGFDPIQGAYSSHDDSLAWHFRPKNIVRALWMPNVDGEDLLPELFSQCPHLVHLTLSAFSLQRLVSIVDEGAMTARGDMHITLLDSYGLMKAKHGHHAAQLVPRPCSRSILDRVTHLHLASLHAWPSFPLRMLPGNVVADFGRLTHLALPFPFDESEPLESLDAMLRMQPTSLRVFLVVFLDSAAYPEFTDWIRQRRVTDRRICGVSISSEDVQQLWITGNRGGPDIWQLGLVQTQAVEDARGLLPVGWTTDDWYGVP